MEKLIRSDDEWRSTLSELAYKVTRKHGTERAFTGEYHDCKVPGTYLCVCCGQPLFASEAKFDSGTCWPSFWQPVVKDAVAEKEDRSWFMKRFGAYTSGPDCVKTSERSPIDRAQHLHRPRSDFERCGVIRRP